jgi:hypothetical protein
MIYFPGRNTTVTTCSGSSMCGKEIEKNGNNICSKNYEQQGIHVLSTMFSLCWLLDSV